MLILAVSAMQKCKILAQDEDFISRSRSELSWVPGSQVPGSSHGSESRVSGSSAPR